jgi:hypothetical protein
MAINFDHTSSANITLKGPENAAPTDVFAFSFPNVSSEGDSSILISGEAPISAISGLVSALSSKVEKNTTGSAASLNYGTSAGQVVRLDSEGKIPNQLISSIIVRDVFTVIDFTDLTSNSSASIGDIGIVSSQNKNYILCSSGTNAYATSSNWKEILFPIQTVTCVNNQVGDVVLDGSNILIQNGNYAASSIDYAIDDLATNKADLSCLTLYSTISSVSTCLNDYVLTSNLTTCLNDYLTDSDFTSCLGNYSTTSDINSCLSNYVLNSSTGSVASLNVGTAAGEVVQLNNDGKIPNEVVPHLAITDTFVVNDLNDLTSLSSAQKGDVAIATGSNKNYILKDTDYSNASHWAQFAASVGSITGINGLAPEEGILVITADDIDVENSNTQYDGQTLSYAISGLDSRITSVNGDYLTDSEASSLLDGYVTTGYATGVFDSKANSVHTHLIGDVTDLAQCLSSISVFCTGDGSYSAVLQSSSNPHYNQALGEYSLALGKAAKTIQPYEVAQGAGLISQPGDAQVSKLIQKCCTVGSSLTAVAEICMQDYSNILFSSYVVGRASNKYAAFKIIGSANREGGVNTTQVLGDIAIDTYVNTNSDYFVDAVADTTDGKIEIKVSGDSSQAMQWVTSSTVTKIIWD